MKSQITILTSLLGLPVPAGLSAHAACKPMMAYYMPWYVAKPYSSTWGWHWTMDHFNPDVINASGEREIASWYYPLIGPYDSADPAVLEYHVLLMKLAGIDGVIVDWYGPDNYADYAINKQRTAALFEFTRRAGLKFSICYEDQTIRQEVNDGFVHASNAIAHAQETMLYAKTNFMADGSFLRWNSRPVVLNFGPQYFKTNSQWEAILSVLDPARPPAFFTEDNRLAVGAGAFDWPPMWLSRAPGTGGVLSIAAMDGYLTDFEQRARAWPAFISSAWPRFHDIYRPAGVRDYWGYLGDRNGDTFRETLGRAMTNTSTIIQIVTWNDYGEGTIVEPTREYGYRDLGIIQDYRRRYLEPTFAGRTNDLMLAIRQYNLRRQSGTNTAVSAELDQVFTNIICGHLSNATRSLTDLETSATDHRSVRNAQR